CEVIDDSRPPQLFRLFVETTDVVGSYRVNERGYLKCVFPDLELTGLPCEQAPELLVFHASRARLGVSFSFVYTRGAAEAGPSAPADPADRFGSGGGSLPGGGPGC